MSQLQILSNYVADFVEFCIEKLQIMRYCLLAPFIGQRSCLLVFLAVYHSLYLNIIRGVYILYIL